MVRAMASGRPGERYILSSQNLTYLDLGSMVAHSLGLRPPHIVVPAWLLRFAAKLNGVFRGRRRSNVTIFVPENADLMTRILYYDASKSVRDLGVVQTTIEPAIRQIDDWIAGEAKHAYSAA
jgi:dihydroflavonol-4-reductase